PCPVWKQYQTGCWGTRGARGGRLAVERNGGALIRMGVWCRPARPTRRERKRGCICDHQSEVECAQWNATEKKVKSCVEELYCLLTQSLLMGVTLPCVEASTP